MGQLNGVKFFQAELEFLDLHYREFSGDHRLTASSLATFLLFHFHCDDFGRIREDELVLKHLAEKYQLPYCSIHSGYHLLFTIGLLRRVTLNDKAYIAITNYENYNAPDTSGRMNYFILPHHLLQSGILNDFIRARDVSGTIGLLHLLNALSREHTRRQKQSIALKVETLLRKMGKTTRNITDWLSRLTLLVGHQEEKKTKQRTLREKLFSFSFVDACFNQTEYDEQKARIRASLRKEVQAMLTSLSLPYTGRDIRDAIRALQQDCLDVFYPISNAELGVRELRMIIHDTIDKTRHILEERIGEHIQNFGGFIRTIIRPILHKHYVDLHIDHKVEMKKQSILSKQPLPAFLKADETLA